MCRINILIQQPEGTYRCVVGGEPEPAFKKYELKAPPLPPRRLSTVSSKPDIPPSSSSTTLYEVSTGDSSPGQPARPQSTHPHTPDHSQSLSNMLGSSGLTMRNSCSGDLLRNSLREHIGASRDSLCNPPQLPPKLPTRASSHNIAAPTAVHPISDVELPPRLPPRPPRGRGIER